MSSKVRGRNRRPKRSRGARFRVGSSPSARSSCCWELGKYSAATSIRCSAPIRARSRRHFGNSRARESFGRRCSTACGLSCWGYGLAIVVGIPIGLVTGRFRTVEAAIGIYITAGYAMPLVALVPLLVLWLGLGFAVKVAIVFLMSVFPICINTWLGVTAVPKALIEVGKSFVAPDAVILRRIILPATLPYIMAGIRLAVGRAVVAMVIAEFFTSISGLGAVIITSANNFDTATMFVPIVILMVMAIGLNYLIGAVERWVAPWQAEIAGREE